MPRPLNLMFPQGNTGRYGRLAGLGEVTTNLSDPNSIDLSNLYPAPSTPNWFTPESQLFNGTSASSGLTTQLSSLWPWLAGGLIVGVLLFRRG
jgi:hypothetical protein